MRLTVIAPTFNESANLMPLADAVQKALQDVDYELLIADDDSPDLTWQRAEEMASRSPRIRVLRRRSEPGLAASVIDGFSGARGGFVACIDADLQHDPAILPAMLRLLEEGNDVVIGSRYVAQGGVRDWNIFRRLQSWIATKLAKVCLGVEVSDPMSGFFMMRREDFLLIKEKLSPQGFKILLEILVALRPERVGEVPYTFGPRLAGKSKLNAGIVFSYLSQLFRLGFRRSLDSSRFLKFAAVGGTGVIVNLLAMMGIVHLSGCTDWRASVGASLVATLNNYLLNNVWTFRDRAHKGYKFVVGYLSYLAMSLIGIAATALTYSALTRIAGQAHALHPPIVVILICQLLSVLVGAYLNFVLNQAYTWRDPRSSSVLATPSNSSERPTGQKRGSEAPAGRMTALGTSSDGPFGRRQ